MDSLAYFHCLCEDIMKSRGLMTNKDGEREREREKEREGGDRLVGTIYQPLRSGRI